MMRTIFFRGRGRNAKAVGFEGDEMPVEEQRGLFSDHFNLPEGYDIEGKTWEDITEEEEPAEEEEEPTHRGCESCQVLGINGVRCHEHGCPDAWRDETRKCKECGSAFRPEERRQVCCDEACARAYAGFEDE